MTNSLLLLSMVLAVPPDTVPVPMIPVLPSVPNFSTTSQHGGSRREVLLPDPAPAPPPIVRGAIPDLPPVPVRPSRVPTLKEFAREFNPTAGVHEVTIIHPVTGRPIDVTFKLPAGRPKVWLYNRSIVFQYPQEEVQILFRLFGRADVRYE
ncbi:MAG: hypothetical protein N2112_03725 [Gemmataceae bacterium]|nr:hypothetical protein [Gemmataceae bacterium]